MSIKKIKSRTLSEKLYSLIHSEGSWDGYLFQKKNNWDAIYFEYDDFHINIDSNFLKFFKKNFKKKLYLTIAPKTNKIHDEFYVIDDYLDFINVWKKYDFESLKMPEHTIDFFVLAFTCESIVIFNDDLDWIFFNNPDMEISSIIYNKKYGDEIINNFSDYSKVQTLNSIRNYISNFASKGFYKN